MDNDDLLWGGFAGFAGGEVQGGGTVGFTSTATTVTETFTAFFGSSSVTFTQESGNANLYQILPPHGSPGSTTFAFSGIGTATVTETINQPYATTTLTYGEVSGSTGAYQLGSELVSFTPPSGGPAVTYSFTETSGSVTAISETVTFGSFSHTGNVPIEPDAVFTLGTGSVTETLANGNNVETLTFTANSSGAYVLSSVGTSFISQGNAGTALDIDPYERAQFTIAGGSVTGESRVSANGTVTALQADSNVSFSVLASGFVEETVTFGSHSAYTVFYSASGSGIYTAIAEGSGTTVDLVGLKAELAQLPAAVAALL
jgi:hypothetical protein